MTVDTNESKMYVTLESLKSSNIFTINTTLSTLLNFVNSMQVEG